MSLRRGNLSHRGGNRSLSDLIEQKLKRREHELEEREPEPERREQELE